MIRGTVLFDIIRGFLVVLFFVYGCDTNPEVETDTIKLSWPLCEVRIGEDIFYDWECLESRKLDGVEVCVEDRPDIPCSTTTSPWGCFELEGIPKDAEVLLSFNKKGYLSRLVPVKTGKFDFLACNWGIERTKLDTSLAFMFPPMVKAYSKKETRERQHGEDCDVQIASLSPKSEYGEIVAIALEFEFNRQYFPLEGNPKKPVRQATIRLYPESGEGSFSERIYTNNKGVPCYRAQEDNRSLDDGFAVFTKVKPGDYLVEFDVSGDYFCIIASVMTDRTVWGFRSVKPNHTRVPVRKGYSTITTIKCYSTNMDAGALDSEYYKDNIYPDSDAGLQDSDVN